MSKAVYVRSRVLIASLTVGKQVLIYKWMWVGGGGLIHAYYTGADPGIRG